MKTSFITFLMVLGYLFPFEVKAQNPPTALFYQGGWKTTDNIKTTAITFNDLNEVKLFRIEATQDNDENSLRFAIVADGKPNRSTLVEGGSLFVEGRSIQITQLNEGTFGPGSWKVIGEEPKYAQLTWVADPNPKLYSTLASLKSPTAFVLSFNTSSIGCKDGQMEVMVDRENFNVGDLNNVLLAPGSSITGIGSKIELRVSGTCDPGARFEGTLKILRPID